MKLCKYIVFFCVIGMTYSQWQNDIRLTNNPYNSQTNRGKHCIRVSGDTIHVVWCDDRDGNYEIYYKRSSDDGLTWSSDTRLTNNSGLSILPELAISGSIVHVVWHDDWDGHFQVYYKRSTNSGVSWGQDIRLSNTFAWSFVVSIDVSGQSVCAVWEDGRDTSYEIYYKLSLNNGMTWGADTRLTHSPYANESPAVSISGQYLHILWQDYRDGNNEIYYMRSTDFGNNWGSETRLTFDASGSWFPCVQSVNSMVHLVWYDNRNGNQEIYYKRSSDNGNSWGADTRLTNDTLDSDYPSMFVSASIIHVVWTDTRDGGSEIYYKQSTNSGAFWGADTRLTNNPSPSSSASCSVFGSTVHVLWNDYRDGNIEIYYKKNPTGNIVNIANLSNILPSTFLLSQNYPNPFNPITNIKFEIPLSRGVSEGQGVFTKLVVYDLLGREIVTLINQQMQPGSYNVDWDASNYPSGVYFYKLEAGEYAESKKMVLIK